jgi:hypothetical protein
VTDSQAPENHHYLARDYNSFRTLLLDHLAGQAADLSGEDAASLEVAIVEVLAYVADYLSYYQDAVATEAYLGTARERVSVRRHARLLDYRLNEGCSARTWVHLETSAGRLDVPRGTALITRLAGVDSVLVPDAPEAGGEVFETIHAATVRRAHNRLPLAQGAAPLKPGDTSARLAGAAPHLAVGDVLVLQQGKGGWSHAVRLVDVDAGEADSTEITWHAEDELPAGLPNEGSWSFLGNIVLADHGRSVRAKEPLLPVHGGEATIACLDLSYALPYRHSDATARSAASAMLQDPRAAEPALWLRETLGLGGDPIDGARPVWTGRREILRASPFERSFAVEPVDEALVRLRFGDGVHARRPDPHWQYRAEYRKGRGARGNIGPNALAHIAFDDDRIVGVANPIAAVGGADPESLDQAREAAPAGCEAQRRCVTEADYEQAVRHFPGVRAVSVRRGAADDAWAVSIHVSRQHGRPLDRDFEIRLRDWLEPVRLIGDELRVVGAHYIRPEVAIELTLERGALSGRTVEAVRRRLAEEIELGFGEALEAARLVACAKSVKGVTGARVTALARPGAAGASPASAIRPGAMEIVLIDPAHLTVLAEGAR